MNFKLFKLYVKLRNFYVNNFFVSVLCLKHNDNFIYLYNNYLIYRYILLFIPFYFIKFIANKYNYDLIYKMDNVYGITNIKETHIIPFIISCSVSSELSSELSSENKISSELISENIISKIRLYNSSIPLHFFIYTNNINEYELINIVYKHKGETIKKKIKFKEIDTKKYLIYNLFN